MSNYTKSTNFATKDNLSPGDPLKIVRGTEIDTEFNNISTAISTKTDNSAAAITGGSITGITDLAIADGGTGASTATAAINNLLPAQTSAANKYLQSDGTNVSWDAVTLSTSDITGTLAVANGGTGITSFGTGVATFLGTPSSANLASAVTDETGSGALVFANTPTLVSPILGTPTSGNFSSGSFTWPTFNQNTTGTAAGLSATLAIASGGTGQTTANAAFNALAPSQTSASGKYLKSDGTNTSWDALDISTADITGTLPVANGGTGVTSSTGTGNVVLSNSPTLVTPVLGTPTSGNFSTGTFTWPTFNQNTTGTAAGLSATLATTSGGTGLTSFTSGGVVYASSTSALATGSALTFDGTSLSLVNGNIRLSNAYYLSSRNNANTTYISLIGRNTSDQVVIDPDGYGTLIGSGGALTLTSTSLYTASGINVGIGTSSPSDKLTVASNSCIDNLGANYKTFSGTNYYYGQLLLKDPSNRTVVLRSPGGVNDAEVGTTTGHPLNIITSDTVRATFDVAGNLGLNCTPTAGVGDTKHIEISGGGAFRSQDVNVDLGANYYYNSGYKYIVTGAASRFEQNSGAYKWYSAASGSAGANISFTQAMTLDASGNLGVGTTSPINNSGYGGFSLNGTSGALLSMMTNGTESSRIASLGDYTSLQCKASTGYITFVQGVSGGTERARIDSSGNLLVGTTNSSNSAGTGIKFSANGLAASVIADSGTAADTWNIYNTTAGAFRFYVTNNGTIFATSTTISAISDERLKENIQDIDTGLDSIMALKPRRFDWKEGKGQDKKNVAGFIAQEFETVFPECVGTSKAGEDGIEYKNVNHETLIPTLVKAIQEQQAIISAQATMLESLKARLDAANL